MSETTDITTTSQEVEIPNGTATEGKPATETPGIDALTEKSALGGAVETDAGKEGDGGENAATVEEKPAGEEKPAELVKYDGLKAPEGFAGLNEAALEAATPLLNQLGVKDTEQAQTVIDAFAKEVMPKMMAGAAEAAQKAQVEQIVAIRKGWLDESRADKEFGGAAFDQNMTVAAKAVEAFGGKPLRDFFDETGIGNHPAVIRAFFKAGQAISEGAIHRSDAAEQRKPDDGELFYGDLYKRKDVAA